MKDLSTGARLLQGRTKDELYEWPVQTTRSISLFASPSPKTTLSSWHARIGHPSNTVLQTLVSHFSLPLSTTSHKQSPCSHCLINKSHKLPFYSNTIHSQKPLEYVYSDVWTSPLISVDNFKYYLVFVDHYTRYTWLYPLKQKSQVRDTFIAFKAIVENRFQTKLMTLYFENGGEFIALRQFLSTHGISHLTSPPHTPEHNGIAERKHRHIVETGLTLLHQAVMPATYWTYAFSTAVYLMNRLPSSVLENTSPYQKLFQQTPNYQKLRVFGCTCYPWLRLYVSHKLEQRSQLCVFLGYSLTQSAYLCLNKSTGRIYTSRHVQFVEDHFPFSIKTVSKTHNDAHEPATNPSYTPSTTVPCPLPLSPLISAPSSLLPRSSDPHQPVSSSSPMNNAGNDVLSPGNTSNDLESNSAGPTSSAHAKVTPTSSPSPNHQIQLEPNLESSPLAPAQTEPIPAPLPENVHPMRTRAKNNIIKPKTKLTLLAKGPSKPQIPTTLTQALRDEKWRNSVGAEINAQIQNN